MNRHTLQLVLLPFFYLLSALTLKSQNCPKLKSALIDGCGRDGVNEFIVFQTRGQVVNLSTIKLEYSSSISFPSGASTVTINPNLNNNVWKNPSVLTPTNGLTNSAGTIVTINPAITTTIPANSTVVIFPEAGAFTNPYDLQLAGSVQVLFYDTTQTSSSWRGNGNFSNYGNTGTALNPRYFRLTTNAGGGCPASQVTSYTPSNLVKQNGTPGAEDGARTNWDDAADATIALSDVDGTVHYLNTGCTSFALPIKLVSFRGSMKEGHAYLQWEITSQSNAVAFTVERSNEGGSYQAVGNVAAQDNILQYSFIDESPASGNNFYRLRMEDVDHISSYSNVLGLTSSAINGISIYPNPVTDRITVRIENGSNALAELIHPDGRVILTRSFAGGNTMTLDLSGYAAGLYLLRISNGQNITAYKLFKQ